MFSNVISDGVDYGDRSGAPVKGVDSVKTYINAWFHAFPDVKPKNEEAFSNVEGSKVIAAGEWTGTFKNDMMGMKSTGKSFQYWDGDLFTFNDEENYFTQVDTIVYKRNGQVGGKHAKVNP